MVKSTEMYSTIVNIEGLQGMRQAVYRYMLLESERQVEYCGKMVKYPCFGIEIIKEEENEVYSDRIEVMTVYRYKVVQLLKKLCDNIVSPVHLIDIAGIMADEWITDFDDQINSLAAQ